MSVSAKYQLTALYEKYTDSIGTKVCSNNAFTKNNGISFQWNGIKAIGKAAKRHSQCRGKNLMHLRVIYCR